MWPLNGEKGSLFFLDGSLRNLQTSVVCSNFVMCASVSSDVGQYVIDDFRERKSNMNPYILIRPCFVFFMNSFKLL